jgi:hypothetical protein
MHITVIKEGHGLRLLCILLIGCAYCGHGACFRTSQAGLCWQSTDPAQVRCKLTLHCSSSLTMPHAPKVCRLMGEWLASHTDAAAKDTVSASGHLHPASTNAQTSDQLVTPLDFQPARW